MKLKEIFVGTGGICAETIIIRMGLGWIGDEAGMWVGSG